MRAFARDYETRPPLQMGEAAARRRGRKYSVDCRSETHLIDVLLSRLPLDSLPSSQGSVARHDTVAGVIDTTAGVQPDPRGKDDESQTRSCPPVVNWGCPVDTSSSALLSRPLRRKNARLTLPPGRL